MHTARRPVKADDARVRVHLLLHAGGLDHFDSRGRAKIEGHEDDIHAVGRDVAERAATEIQPAPPGERMIEGAIGRKLTLLFRTEHSVALRPYGLVRTLG